MKKFSKTVKYVLLIFIVAILLYIISQISIENIFFNSKANAAIKFVNDKYQKNFIPTYTTNNLTECYTDGMYPENDEIVKVYRVRDNFFESHFTDNYFRYIIRPDVEDHLSSFFQKEFTEFKIYHSVDSTPVPNELTPDSTLEDLIKIDPTFCLDAIIYIKHNPSITVDEYKQKFDNIKNQFLANNNYYRVSAYIIDEDAYNTTSRYNFSDFFATYVLMHSANSNVKCNHPNCDEVHNKIHCYEYRCMINDGETISSDFKIRKTPY